MRYATVLALVGSLAGAGQLFAQQGLPTSQPKYLQIIMEDVKVGHDDDHSKTEAGWPAAFEKAKSPYFGIGMVALTGLPQAWFLTPYESNQAFGESMKLSAGDPALAAELSRLSKADAEHITNIRTVMLSARKDLSRGAFPDVSKIRFYEITIFRVRPGHEAQFESAGKAYGSAAGRAAPNMTYRVYEVSSGMAGSVYFVINSVPAFADFDKAEADGEATMKAMNAEERSAMEKFSAEALINAETHRFRIDPNMSYVPAAVRAQDPFWAPKKPMVKKPTTN